MGPYCQYCDHRCFVPDPDRPGWLKATCQQGMIEALWNKPAAEERTPE